jgi:hypothetical protein
MKRIALACGFAVLLGTSAQAVPTVVLDFGTDTALYAAPNPGLDYAFVNSTDTVISFTWAGLEVGGSASLEATQLHPTSASRVGDHLGTWTLLNDGPDTLLGFSVLLPSSGLYRSAFDLDSDISSQGRDGQSFTYVASSPEVIGQITVSYDFQLPSVDGDQWQQMNVDFSGLDGGGLAPGSLNFLQDADTYFPPDPPPVMPLPGSALLLATPLAGLMALRRRKRKNV